MKRCGGITTWRSAANAPDGIQNASIMLGAFVSCNGGLGAAARRLVMCEWCIPGLGNTRKSGSATHHSLVSPPPGAHAGSRASGRCNAPRPLEAGDALRHATIADAASRAERIERIVIVGASLTTTFVLCARGDEESVSEQGWWPRFTAIYVCDQRTTAPHPFPLLTRGPPRDTAPGTSLPRSPQPFARRAPTAIP
jgi:hypothetical protein